MKVNTTSLHPTHFLRGVELVIKASETFNVPSENWPYPTNHRYGIPVDNYYAEVWHNGMDWQSSFWAIEEIKLSKPICRPLIIFDHYEEFDKFNGHDFSMLIKGALYYRNDKYFIKHYDLGIFSDFVWPYLKCISKEQKFGVCQKFEFEHASQKVVKFWMNIDFVPDSVLDNEDNGIDEFDGNVVDIKRGSP
jgi:hypothetical protein